MTLPDLDSMKPLGEPFEILELHDGESREVRSDRWDIGKATIHPRDGRPAKVIPVMRLHVSAADKPDLPQYWDVTAKHLIAGLLGHLNGRAVTGRVFRITKHGTGPQARFTLDVRPA